MLHQWPLLGVMLCVVASSAIAQESLPGAVQSVLNEQTVLVVRIDLARSDVAMISKVFEELPDPSSQFGRMSSRFGQAFKKLAALNVREVFLVLSTEDLPNLQPTLIVPAVGRDAERDSIASSLKSLWQDKVETSSDGVVVSESESGLRLKQRKSSPRPEYSEAFAVMKDSPVQLAFGIGKDVRRVLGECLPQLPGDFGASSVRHLANGWKWIALGITPSSMPSAKLIVQGKDVQSAESLQQIAIAGLKMASESEGMRSLFKDATGLEALLTPSRKSDQLVLELSQSNRGAVRIMNEVVIPLAGQMEMNSRRLQTIEHLKKIALAMHLYFDKHNKFPTAAVVNSDGKKLLSWRVLLLPYLGEEGLYNEFRMDESWDSEHNMKLVPRMPDVFNSSRITRAQRVDGMTAYLAPIADKTLFATPDGATIKQITDGTSNTIMVVDANAEVAVPWTKPDDLLVDFKQPLKGLGGQADGSFWAALCDGSVRRIQGKVDGETVRRLFQMNDGESLGEF